MLGISWTAIAAPLFTIEPADEPVVGSCLAFGAGPGDLGGGKPGFPDTSPYMGWIYQGIPAFDLNPGDILAFDLGKANDADVELDIDMVATTADGETTEAGPFTKVVNNTYTPLKPRGDNIIGNFELRFVVDGTYSFPGGGLIIRFSNGSDAYRDDVTCTQVGVVATAADASGNFLLAFWDDETGVSPWGPQQPPLELQSEIINGFQIIKGPTVLLASDTLDQNDASITAAAAGDTLTYRVKAQNPGNSDATGVVVTVTLDDRVSFMSSTPSLLPSGSPATLEWLVGTLAPGAEVIMEVDLGVLINAGGQTISNVAEVTASDVPLKTGLQDQSDVAIDVAIDIVGELFDSSDNPITTIQVGEPFVYRITASNSSQADGTGVEVMVTWPENIEFQLATPPLTPDSPETIIWTIGDLSSGTDTTLDIELIATFAASATELSGTANLTVPSQGEEVLTLMEVESAIDIITNMLDADGAIISEARTGDAVRYEIVVTNRSEADATGLEVTAFISGFYDYIQSTPTPDATITVKADPPATVIWRINTLPAGVGTEATLIVDLEVPFAASGQIVRNSGALTASDAEDLIGGSAFSDIKIDYAILPLASTQDSNGTEITSANVGELINYELVVRNKGGVAATGFEIVTTLADNLTFKQASQSTATYDAGPPATVTWVLDSILPESDAILDIGLEINFSAGGLLIKNSSEITASDATLVIGLIADSEITISTEGVDLLKGGSGNCFIATAAYGSYLEPEVMVLRQFRDKYLLTNEPGRAFVAWYYRNSPEVAAQIAENELARLIVRLLLSPIVYSVKYPVPVMLSIFLIVFVGGTRKSARSAR